MAIAEQIISRLFRDSPGKLPVEQAQVVDGGKVIFRVAKSILTGKSKPIVTAVTQTPDPKKLFSGFHIDTMGHLFILSNLSIFLKLAEDLTQQCYTTNLIQAQHIHFSMREVEDSWYEFSFHVSLLHDIVVDTLYNYVNIG